MVKTTRSGERGQTLVIFSLLLVALCGFVALTVDAGLILYNRTDNQKTADAAALAAAQELPDAASAVAVAEQYLEANGFDLNDPDNAYVITTPYQGDSGQVLHRRWHGDVQAARVDRGAETTQLE